MVKETVILLHGIGNSRWDMAALWLFLRLDKYDVINLSYPSTSLPLDELGTLISQRLEREKVWLRQAPVHFVTHSLGGLVVQRMLGGIGDAERNKVGRLVMIGTPNGGSEVADYLQGNLLYRYVFGPAGQELTTHARQKKPEAVFCETGVIAGTSIWTYPLSNALIPWDNKAHDGRVSVNSTKTEWMKDHITLPVPHGLMTWSPKIYKQVASFLKTGAFIK